MKIDKSDLLHALAIVKPGLASTELSEQTTSFAFIEGRVVTYNDEISISHPVPEVDFEGAINAKELYGLLSKIKKNEINIEDGETELLVTSGRIKAGLKKENEIKLPLREIPRKTLKISNPARFSELLSMAMQTCSDDPTQAKLGCVSIMKNGVMVAADNYRLLQCQADPLPIDGFLLPASSAKEIVKIEPTSFFKEPGWIHFKNKKGTVISSRRLEDDYIPSDAISQVLKFSKLGTIEFPDEIDDVLKRVSLFSSGSQLEEVVEVTIENGKMRLKATSEETGSWIEERVAISYDGSITFLITPSLFKDILQVTKSCVIDKSLTKIKFSSHDWEYVVMIRLRPESKEKTMSRKTKVK